MNAAFLMNSDQPILDICNHIQGGQLVYATAALYEFNDLVKLVNLQCLDPGG